MVTAPRQLLSLLESGDVLGLGLLAGRQRAHRNIGFLEDEAVWPAWTHPPESAPRMIYCLDEAQLKKARSLHPDVWVHGPVEGADSFALVTPELGKPWAPASYSGPVVASFTYPPGFAPEHLLDRLEALSQVANLVAVSPLPAAVGDRVLVPGATTDGTDDAAVLAACRLVLPKVHVRSSWAALGWKVAQVCLAFGADTLSGWGAEEQLVYSSRTRPASTVDREEVEQGIREAGFEPVEVSRCDWDC